MRIPLSWLAEFVEVPEGTTAEQVHAALVSVGFEEEDIHTSGVTGPLVVGEVLEFVDEPQSNGKTIRWCQVRVAPEGRQAADGGESVRGIVCGAANFEAGDKVVVCLPGAVLPGDFAIAARKTYGHVSDGMMASARELGLGEDHDGIIRLGRLGLDAEVGADARALLHLDDSAVEINVTPDRGYGFSIRGIAREYSHATGAAFRDPAEAVPAAAGSGFSVVVDDRAPIREQPGSTMFITRAVRGIDATRATPSWMVARLGLAGIRSISLPVDITNYVMLELGQPIHGYDLDKLSGGITVRRALPGERLTTLDGVQRALDPEDLLITDESGAIGLAGVMGGQSTEIADGTVDVLIEAANFDRVSIARTARRHKLPSEASKRFERGVDPAVAAPAAARVVQLLVELAGGTADALGSVLDARREPAAIELPLDYPAALVGLDYTREQIVETLTRIGATVVEHEAGPSADAAAGAAAILSVTPPSWRPDLAHKADLVEEIARLVGYDRIPEELPVAPPGRGLSRSQLLRRAASNSLAAAGYTEVTAFPFLPAGQNQRFSRDGAAVAELALSNPLDGEAPFLRRSLLPGLLQVAHRNHARGLVDLAVFEQGLVFAPEQGASYGHAVLPEGGIEPDAATLAMLNAAIPPQPRHLAVLLLGSVHPKQPGLPAAQYGWQDALEAVQRLARGIGATITVRQGSHAAFHPGRCAELFAVGGAVDGTVSGAEAGEVSIGFAGELLPELTEQAHLPRVVAAAELDLDALFEHTPELVQAGRVWTAPAATQDLSLVVADTTPAGSVLAAVREGAGELLEDIRLVDDYRGSGVEPGQKSLTFALRFRAEGRTLTAAEASEAKLAGVALAARRFEAAIRE